MIGFTEITASGAGPTAVAAAGGNYYRVTTAQTLNLPLTSVTQAGRMVAIHNAIGGAGNVVVAATAPDTLDAPGAPAAATITLTQGQSVILRPRAGSWEVVANAT